MQNARHARGALAVLALFFSLSYGCLPVHDLDKAVGGQTGTSGGAGGQSSAHDAGSTGGLDAAAGGATVDAAILGSGGTTSRTGGTTTAAGGSGGTAPRSGGTSGMAGSTAGAGRTGSPEGDAGTSADVADGGGAGGVNGGVAPPLPDIPNSPVRGQITYSAGASWDIDGDQWPAFEIHTPTGNYWLVKSAAAIVSITDTSGVQWINFASGFRANRGVPNLGGCCQPGNPEKLGLPVMTTEIDPDFIVTSTHLRLISKSDDGGYHLVWDFFLTHFTLTVNRSAKPFGFTFRGAPGGNILSTDELVLSSGEVLSPADPYSSDLAGPAEWVYYDRPTGKDSLFLIQHTDDAITDSYQVADLDTPMWVFGGDQTKKRLTHTPVRFSLGLLDSATHADVAERIRFVISAIH